MHQRRTAMMLKLLLTLCALVPLAWSRTSPNAEYIRNMPAAEKVQYDANLLEDAVLDVPDLITKYGYPVEVHKVTTQDGYILELHRIPYAKGEVAPTEKRTPVFVMHGMFSSSADWVLIGPQRALAYALADAGFDVWLGNARGNYYSRNHVSLNPDEDLAFWQFSWDDIGHLDLAASIDYVLDTTGLEALHYVSHSQGGTTFFVLTSLRPEYNAKILSLQAMAPAVYNSNSDRAALEMVAPYLRYVEILLANLFGISEMFPNSDLFTRIGLQYCTDDASTQIVCRLAFYAFGGFSFQQMPSYIPVILGHTPAGASFRQIAHFGQVIATGEFKRYDYGTIQNILNYGRANAPEYNLSAVSAPVYIYYADGDRAVVLEDLNTLVGVLPNVQGLIRVENNRFNHIDYLYGSGARWLVYDRIIAAIKAV